MRASVSALRKAAIVLVAACSVVCAVFLVWQLVSREQVGMLSNGHLIGMLALFLLPGGTLAAWELDRRAAARIPEIAEASEPPAASEPRPGAYARHEEHAAAEELLARAARHRHHSARRDRTVLGR